MTRPITARAASTGTAAKTRRSESPVTVLDSEEERQEFYALQREKRRKRKLEKGLSESDSGSASASGSGNRQVYGLPIDVDDSVRILGAKRGRKSSELTRNPSTEDEEIQLLAVVPTGPMLRLAPKSTSVKSASAIATDDEAHVDDADAPSVLRAGLAKFKYSHQTTSSTTGAIPTSRTVAAVALRARSSDVKQTGSHSPVTSASHTGSVEEAVVLSNVKDDAITAGSGTRKRAAKKVKAVVPDMPVEAEQLKELDACVICDTKFDRRKTAKTRWQHMVDCFSQDHKAGNARPDLTFLVSQALDKLSRNTFHPALATQTTLLQSVALEQPKPGVLCPAAPGVPGDVPSIVDMHFDQSKSGRARLNARKRALAGRKGGKAAEVCVLGVYAESRGGVGLSEEIRNLLDEEYADDFADPRLGGPTAAIPGTSNDDLADNATMDVDSLSDQEVPFPPTQAFGRSDLQMRMQAHRGKSRGIFEDGGGSAQRPLSPQPTLNSEPDKCQPFRGGEVDRLDGSSSRIGTVKTCGIAPETDGERPGEGEGDQDGGDRCLERHQGHTESWLAGSELGIGRGDVCDRAQWGQSPLVARKTSLWAAASGI
ncbi:hypothetical protein QFC19_003922 [Naganishia cerealis]|uniref:Uncharacterized protein n=1 Tax=Naganishia cerealis TaxID=610337 RepID=A0ACC2W087_9TREE|nr:hypothetical protein QFC19_003922 [Naganishia cerealis]